jgi:dephospho-CoA kinase
MTPTPAEQKLTSPDPGRPLVVAVTGGIASGKSALTSRFAELGVPVSDADIAARAVVEPGTSGLAEIVEAFGDDVLDAEGGLDRRRLRERVFADSAGRRRLEAIVHPRVRAWLAEAVLAWRGDYGLLAIPLLAENAKAYRWVDRVLVVDVPRSLQLGRLMHRDDIGQALAESILAAQATRERRLAIADDVHDATGPLESLPGRVARLHRHYLSLSRAKREGWLPPPRIRTVA